MSYTEIKVVMGDGEVSTFKEYRNAWGGFARIWDAIYKRYIENPYIEFDTWLSNSERLWPATKDNRIPFSERIVLASTYDMAIVEYERLPEYVAALRAFVTSYPTLGIDHLPEWADDIEKIFDEETANTYKGICYYGISIGDDMWSKYDEDTEEYYNYNVITDDKHWFVFEEMTKIDI